jgi:periplasmic divalent cation tolerance protein
MTGTAADLFRAPALVWCPFPDADSAAAAAERLLDEGLIACANILPGMISHFVWNGERGTSEEIGAILKTNAATLDALTRRLAELHPYEEPAIVGWHCDAAAPGTAAWLAGLGR